MNMNQMILPVSNMDEATDFYRRMGFFHIVDTPHYARFECADSEAAFSLSLEEGGFSNGSVIYFENAAIDELVDELKSKGFEFNQDPADMGYL